MQSYDVSARTTAPPEVVWGLLIDARTWPTWTPIDSLDVERSVGLGADGVDPVGAVRAFRTGRVVTGERLTAIDPGRRLHYEDAFNRFMHDYRATIEIEPTSAGGTAIHWHGTYRTRRGTGWFWQRYMQNFMQKMADGLAAAAASPASGDTGEHVPTR